jgi:hypothetical protein
VGDDHDRDLLAQLHDQVLDDLRRLRVKRRARLVQQQDLGVDRERAGDAQPLLLATGQAQRRVPEIVLDLSQQAGVGQNLANLLVEVGPPRPALGLLAQDVGDVVEYAHRERVRLLEDHRHAATQRGRVEAHDVGAVERDATAHRRRTRELGQAVERTQQRRLAAARRADQREHLAFADRERDLVDRELGAVGDRHVLDRHALDREGGRRGVTARRAGECGRRG